jgi:hypothetical protein
MAPIRFIIFLTTAYLLFYALTPYIDSIPIRITVVLWLFSHVLLVYMVVRVLRKGIPSTKRFDEGYWYEDKEKNERI